MAKSFTNLKGRASNAQSFIDPKPFIDKGHGYIASCGNTKQESYKGWITITDTIPKGTKVHVSAYRKPSGLSLRLGKPQN